ncbi:DUF6195 family protein [Streptomyces sp. NPDC005799]|uniref:DUF6195 family protein n=1 Tax=Streptomyces sp. NPDC005799 TaxID=3154678 RepID=UPI0033E235FA
MSLNDIAKAAYADQASVDAEQQAAHESEAAEEFLAAARHVARNVLGEAAEVLPWQYTPWAQAAKDTEEATAALAPGLHHTLALRYAYTQDDERAQFGLVQTCVSCGCRIVTEVTSLHHLGKLLDEADGPGQAHADGRNGAEGDGPFGCADSLLEQATSLVQLVRRLVARHPQAGVAVDMASLLSHSSGSTTGRLRLETTTAEAAAEVAASLGMDVTTEVTGASGSYVFRRTRGLCTVDGIEVQIEGYTQLPDDEAAAWRSQQDQAAEDGGS